MKLLHKLKIGGVSLLLILYLMNAPINASNLTFEFTERKIIFDREEDHARGICSFASNGQKNIIVFDVSSDWEHTKKTVYYMEYDNEPFEEWKQVPTSSNGSIRPSVIMDSDGVSYILYTRIIGKNSITFFTDCFLVNSTDDFSTEQRVTNVDKRTISAWGMAMDEDKHFYIGYDYIINFPNGSFQFRSAIINNTQGEFLHPYELPVLGLHQESPRLVIDKEGTLYVLYLAWNHPETNTHQLVLMANDGNGWGEPIRVPYPTLGRGNLFVGPDNTLYIILKDFNETTSEITTKIVGYKNGTFLGYMGIIHDIPANPAGGFDSTGKVSIFGASNAVFWTHEKPCPDNSISFSITIKMMLWAGLILILLVNILSYLRRKA